MSTPIEIYDPLTKDSIFVDEYGLCGLSVVRNGRESRGDIELSLDSVLQLIELLSRASQVMLEKRLRNCPE